MSWLDGAQATRLRPLTLVVGRMPCWSIQRISKFIDAPAGQIKEATRPPLILQVVSIRTTGLTGIPIIRTPLRSNTHHQQSCLAMAEATSMATRPITIADVRIVQIAAVIVLLIRANLQG